MYLYAYYRSLAFDYYYYYGRVSSKLQYTYLSFILSSDGLYIIDDRTGPPVS